MLKSLISKIFYTEPKLIESNTTSTDCILSHSNLTTVYNPNLIPLLLHEHQEIIRFCLLIQDLAQESRWAEVQSQMKLLASLLHHHMDAETATLYAQMQGTHAPNSQETEIIQLIRSEMRAIGNELLDLINFYTTLNSNQINQAEFLKQFSKTFYRLRCRIELEESTLYPLYEVLYKKT